jgi:hypothetical protein
VFETTVAHCMAKGLVGGNGFAFDASMFKADANCQPLPGTRPPSAAGDRLAHVAGADHWSPPDLREAGCDVLGERISSASRRIQLEAALALGCPTPCLASVPSSSDGSIAAPSRHVGLGEDCRRQSARCWAPLPCCCRCRRCWVASCCCPAFGAA